MPQSAHDVVWCANRGASPVILAATIPSKPHNVNDEYTGLDRMKPEDDDWEVYQMVLGLFANQKTLVKTIKNDCCDEFLEKLKGSASTDTTFRTSTTLLPPSGLHMRLFGSDRQYSAGFVWDRSDMDLSSSWAWPSGYYAKTEFNIDRTGRLKNGRDEALVSIEALLAANQKFTDVHSFNEVYAHLGVDSLVGVFSRTLRYDHLLHAMGLQTAIIGLTGRWIPVLVLDPTKGVQAFCRRHQLLLLRQFMEEVNPTANAILMKPFLPVEIGGFQTLTPEELMQFHGSYGCTESCLDTIFANSDAKQLMQWVLVGLRYAVYASNLVAARLLITRAGPLAVKHPDTVSVAQVVAIVQNTSTESMLPLVGALSVLAVVNSGEMARRLKEALSTLEQWLEQSDSLSFRVASWRNMKNHPDSKMLPFVGNQAIVNRTKFYNSLQRLANCEGLLYYLIELSMIVSSLHHPCLRLDLLQYILGLDTRFTASCLRETVDLAVRCAVSNKS